MERPRIPSVARVENCVYAYRAHERSVFLESYTWTTVLVTYFRFKAGICQLWSPTTVVHELQQGQQRPVALPTRTSGESLWGASNSVPPAYFGFRGQMDVLMPYVPETHWCRLLTYTIISKRTLTMHEYTGPRRCWKYYCTVFQLGGTSL